MHLSILSPHVCRLIFRLVDLVVVLSILLVAKRTERIVLNTVGEGLKQEKECGSRTYFRNFVNQFESFNGLLFWLMHVLPMMLLGLTIALNTRVVLQSLDTSITNAAAIFLAILIGGWCIYCHKSRYVPFKNLVSTKNAIFGSC